MDQEDSVRPCGDRKRQLEEEAEKGVATESIHGHGPTETPCVLSTHLSRTSGQEGGGDAQDKNMHLPHPPRMEERPSKVGEG